MWSSTWNVRQRSCRADQRPKRGPLRDHHWGSSQARPPLAGHTYQPSQMREPPRLSMASPYTPIRAGCSRGRCVRGTVPGNKHTGVIHEGQGTRPRTAHSTWPGPTHSSSKPPQPFQLSDGGVPECSARARDQDYRSAADTDQGSGQGAVKQEWSTPSL